MRLLVVCYADFYLFKEGWGAVVSGDFWKGRFFEGICDSGLGSVALDLLCLIRA